MTARRVLIALTLAAGVAGCAEKYLAVDAEGNHTATPPRPAPPAAAPAAYTPPPPDRCGAASLQYLVGRPKSEIPVPVDPGRRRVVCNTCIVSHLDDPTRQTILFDAPSGVVTGVVCQ